MARITQCELVEVGARNRVQELEDTSATGLSCAQGKGDCTSKVCFPLASGWKGLSQAYLVPQVVFCSFDIQWVIEIQEILKGEKPEVNTGNGPLSCCLSCPLK